MAAANRLTTKRRRRLVAQVCRASARKRVWLLARCLAFSKSNMNLQRHLVVVKIMKID